MAWRRPWSVEEWALVIELVDRFEETPPAEEIDRVQRVLRAAALTSDEPRERREAADPRFRTLSGVWQQYYAARRARDPDFRESVPANLARAWRTYEDHPDALGRLARTLREGTHEA